MRVLLLVVQDFDGASGTFRSTANDLSLALTRKGHDVTLLVSEDRGLPDDLSFDIIHSYSTYRAAGSLKEILKQTPHVRTYQGRLCGDYWPNRATIGATPAVRDAVKRYFRQGLERKNLRLAAAITVANDKNRDDVVSRFGVDRSKVAKIPDGVDTGKYRPAKDQGALRVSLDLPKDRNILFCLTRLLPRTDLENLIAAIIFVKTSHPDTLLVIPGNGPQKAKLQQFVRDAKLDSSCCFVGNVPDDLMVSYLQASDACILPSAGDEGHRLYTLAALGCGTPVVGVPASGMASLLWRLDKSLISRNATPLELARAIVPQLESRKRDGHLTDNRFRAFVEDNYSWEAHVDATESLYQTVVNHAAV